MNEDFSLGKLAKKIIIPEYKLRKIINLELGYENFRDFINRYRIKEAAQRLSKQGNINTKIISIAYEVGFSSLAPFNKSFKRYYKISPSEYRRKKTSS